MHTISTSDIIAFTFLGLLLALAIFYLSVKYAETTYLMAYRKPAVVHFYPFMKKLPPYAGIVLENEFRFYGELSDLHKKYFQHRVATFLKEKEIIGKDGLEVTNDMKLKVAATWVILTFGLRHYLTDLFNRVVLYPDVYHSRLAGEYKFGEFNAQAQAVVFSWKHFESGLNFTTNNLNLGLHEFARVVHAGSVRKSFGAGGDMYVEMYHKILEYIYNEENLIQIVNANYFRHYAYKGEREFMAVIIEYFFETPDEFNRKLPELYTMVATMMNYRRAA